MTTTHTAICEGCGKSWKVPAADKRYACKDCGGVVRVPADPAPAAPAPPEPVVCLACRAPLAEGEAFCPACGVARGDTEARQSPEDRRQINREYGKVKRIIGTLRALFIANALFSLFLGFVLFSVIDRLEPEDQGGARIMGWAFFGLAIVELVGAALVQRRPLIWAILLAAFRTLLMAASVLGGATFLDLVFDGFFTLAHWAGVQQAARLESLRKRYPELAAKSQFTGKGVKGGQRMAQSKQQARAALRSRLLVAGIVAVLAVGAWLLSKVLSAPPALDKTIDRFEIAWQAKDVDTMAELMVGESAAKAESKLRNQLRDHSWLDFPGLTRAELTDADGRGQVRWSTSRGNVETSWKYDGKRWRMLELTLPKIQAGPPDAELAAFMAAWERSDLDAILGLFDPLRRERFERSFRRIIERREWTGKFPKLNQADLHKDVRGTRTEMIVGCADGVLETSWEFRAGKWYLSSMKFPE